MKVQVSTDKRDERDQYFDREWEKLIKAARLNPLQTRMCREYLRKIEKEQLVELLDISLMAGLLALIEAFNFGTGKTAKRLGRYRDAVNNILEDVFDKKVIIGDLLYSYDGCAVERLRHRLHKYGVEYAPIYEENKNV